MQTYKGACHCGHIQFEVDLVLDHVRVCDCSVCRKRGALNFRVKDDQIRVQTPLVDMTLYQWHTMTAKDYFCPFCGILPFRRPRTAPEIWTVNIRCLDNVSLDEIPVRKISGSQLS